MLKKLFLESLIPSRIRNEILVPERSPFQSMQKPFLKPFFKAMSTLLGVPSCVRFCQQEFGEFPWLVGRYCSYLLPKQAGGTPQIIVDKTSCMTGRLRV